MDNNLHYMRTEAPLLAPIFRSDGQARLLSALFLTGDELSVTGLAERTDLAYPTVHREVGRLLDAGILVERTVGRTRLIRQNDDSPLVGPLRQILVVSAGPATLLTHELERIAGIEVALLYGSFAARPHGIAGPAPQDIDLMVIGTPDADEVHAACDRVGVQVRRAVNATILTRREAAKPNAFLRNVAAHPVVLLIGEPRG
jgi:DNA-binding transcriptional ArsR family regulator